MGSGLVGGEARLQLHGPGLAYQQTSYDGWGTVVNQVQDAYNGFGQPTQQFQSHSGAVNTSSTPSVQYAYSTGDNNSRLTSETYPNQRVLDYNYTGTVDSAISRVDQLADAGGSASGNLQSYTYLGLNTIVQASDGNGVALSYIQQSGDSHALTDGGDRYTGLDRFGRILDQNWVNISTGVSTDRFQYGYDRNSDVLYKNNVVNSSFSELYHANSTSSGDNNTAYDPLNRLKNFSRGTLSASGNNGTGGLDTITSPVATNSWALDAQGNRTGTNGASTGWSSNSQNQVTVAASGGSTYSFGYDANGNLKSDNRNGGEFYKYDAWNRLVKASIGSGNATYSYDALSRRTYEGSTGRDLYYDASGNVIEERNSSGTVMVQNVWGLLHVNSLVLRDDAFNGSGGLGLSGSGLGERLYVQQDAGWNTTALVRTDGSVAQRTVYDPFGSASLLYGNWTSVGTDFFYMRYLFQGGRQDQFSGLVHFSQGGYGRDYSTFLGSWFEQEPFGGAYIDGTNLYQAMGSNPTTYADPSGLTAVAPSMGPGLVEIEVRTADVDSTQWIPGVGQAVDIAVAAATLIDLQSNINTKVAYQGFAVPTNPLSGKALPANVTGGDSGRPNAPAAHHSSDAGSKDDAAAGDKAAANAGTHAGAGSPTTRPSGSGDCPNGGSERPDLGKPGTLRNPDGTRKDPADQLKQIQKAKKRGGLIDNTDKSDQNLKNKLRKPYNPEDYDD